MGNSRSDSGRMGYKDLLTAAVVGAAILPAVSSGQPLTFYNVDADTGALRIPMSAITASVGTLFGLSYAFRAGAAPATRVVTGGVSRLKDESKILVGRIRTWFAENGIKGHERAAAASLDEKYSREISNTLAAAGKPHETIASHGLTIVLAKYDDLATCVYFGPHGPRITNHMTVTVASIRPLGDEAPSAIRFMSDGTSVGLWVNDLGVPTRSVVYDGAGHPERAFDLIGGTLSKSGAQLAGFPLLRDIQGSMAAEITSFEVAKEILLDRIRASIDPQTHSLSDEGGTWFVRDRAGRLDNPSRTPAAVEADGTRHFALDGRVLDDSSYRHALEKRGGQDNAKRSIDLAGAGYA